RGPDYNPGLPLLPFPPLQLHPPLPSQPLPMVKAHRLLCLLLLRFPHRHRLLPLQEPRLLSHQLHDYHHSCPCNLHNWMSTFLSTTNIATNFVDILKHLF
ncbi:unnamed protein product, partial [Musa textilis]